MQIAELVATEFFEQGDKEREELNIEPIVSTSSMPYHLQLLFCIALLHCLVGPIPLEIRVSEIELQGSDCNILACGHADFVQS